MMVNVAGYNGQQAEQQYDTCCIDDWMQRLDAWREMVNTAQVLQQKRDFVGNCVWLPLEGDIVTWTFQCISSQRYKQNK